MRRIISETKKFVTEAAWDAANLAMQITGGIGYTDVYPIERAVRDTRLAQIWTGTNEIMSAMIQHDLYQEFRAERGLYRDFERDAMHADDSERIFDDDGASLAEIGRDLGVSRERARQLEGRAKKKIRLSLEGSGISDFGGIS